MTLPSTRAPEEDHEMRIDPDPLRIAYVTMSFPASTETFASNDVRRLAASGMEMSVHSLRAARPEAQRLLVERGLQGITVSHHAGARTVARAVVVSLRRPRAALSLLTLLLRSCISTPKHLVQSLFLYPRALEVFGTIQHQRPDVVHAYWAHYPSMVLHLVQTFMPEVVTSISFSVYDIHHRFPITEPVSHRADVVRSLAVVTAQETAETFGLPEASIEIIHDSVDLALVPPPRHRVPKRILTVGRLDRPKGTEHVLRAFAGVHQRYPDATLRVLGSGPELERLRVLTAELDVVSAVTFVGHVAQTDVLDEMRQAEVFLFLSQDERLPNVVKEAMVCGCLCIVSRTIGIDELVEDGVSGFIVEQRDHDRAVEHISRIFAGLVPVDAMTEAAAAHIREAFDLRVTIARYLELWRAQVSRRHAQAQPAVRE